MAKEEELMAAYVAGDASAFDQLFNELAPSIHRVMQRGLFRPEDATDLVQQTFMQLHRARHDFKPGARLRPWLFTIAMNLKREYLRKKKRRPEAVLELDGRTDPVDQGGAARSDAQDAVSQALNALSPDQREVIELHWFAGMPFPDVAQVVGASLSAVKVRAHRGYAAMRQFLEADGNRSGVGT